MALHVQNIYFVDILINSLAFHKPINRFSVILISRKYPNQVYIPISLVAFELISMNFTEYRTIFY